MKPIQTFLLLASFCAALCALASGCSNHGAAPNDLDAQRKAVMGSPAPPDVQKQIAAYQATQNQRAAQGQQPGGKK